MQEEVGVTQRSDPPLAWLGSVADGRIGLRTPEGASLVYSDLAGLVGHLHERCDPSGGFVACAASLGIALHAARQTQEEAGPLFEQIAALLAGLPVAGVIARMRRCAAKHLDILRGAELAARLVLEARRVQRAQSEAVVRVGQLASTAIPSRRVLLAWPGGSACDLGDGILTGALIAAGRASSRPGDVLIAGPEALATSAVADLAKHGIAAQTVDQAQALAAVQGGGVGAVLVRALTPSSLAEGSAAELVAGAARRRVPVIAIGVQREAVVADLPLPAGCRCYVEAVVCSTDGG